MNTPVKVLRFYAYAKLGSPKLYHMGATKEVRLEKMKRAYGNWRGLQPRSRNPSIEEFLGDLLPVTVRVEYE